MEKIILVDKPKGITSFDVIRKLRKQLGVRKMGHAGTLDPLASGLLLIGVGDGTKELANLIGLEKTYVAEVILGKQTSTGDLEGEIIKQAPVSELDKSEVEDVLRGMIGVLELAVPVYSAVKKQGKPLYKYARAGQAVEPPTKSMEILSAKLLNMKLPVLEIEFEVKSGVYIRSVAEELGRRLDTVATLANLRRTRIGSCSVEDAIEIEER